MRREEEVVALSEKELRMLEQMERALVEEDPKLASTLRGTPFEGKARTRALIAGVGFLAGVGLLLGGVIWRSPVVGVAGFVVMLGAATVAVTALRATPSASSDGDDSDSDAAPRESAHPGLGVVDGGKRHRPRRPKAGGSSRSGSMMERFEQRWRQRRERGF